MELIPLKASFSENSYYLTYLIIPEATSSKLVLIGLDLNFPNAAALGAAVENNRGNYLTLLLSVFGL